ncbi:hypothetical protein Tco_0073242 [Tanacetum coccineum]
MDEIGAKPPYYARKDFLDYHFPGEWDISRDAELNPFKDTLVFRRMVEFLGTIPINLKCNMRESEDLIKKPINWDKPPKNEDGAWQDCRWMGWFHALRFIATPLKRNITTPYKYIPTTSKLSARESPERSSDMTTSTTLDSDYRVIFDEKKLGNS